MKTYLLTTIIALALVSIAGASEKAHVVWLEAEAFTDTGRWSNDPQHVDIMGSPYLLATGVGKPVDDATTTAKIPASGEYRLWVRCRDWLPGHSPGKFQVVVGGKAAEVTFGQAKTDAWQWIDGGAFDLAVGNVEVRLHDLSGWWGRCDAVVLSNGDFKPADDLKQLAAQRLEHFGVAAAIEEMGPYDVVVVGGGPAGIGAALAAARGGCKVAFVQDRPVLGGNSSSEISVPPMGYIGNPPDKVNISGIAKEVFPKQGWHTFADSTKIERIVRAEENISLFLNTRATGVVMDGKSKIESVIAINVHSGKRMAFTAPRFIDCTGHGWVGFYAGAEYRMGQEARAEFGESLAPVKAGKRTQGNTLYKAIIKDHGGGNTTAPISAAPGSVVKHGDKARVTLTGDWTHSKYGGGDYLHDDKSGKGEKTAAFALDVKKPGQYEVFLGYRPLANRAASVPVTIEHADGKTTVGVDQRISDGGWKLLGTFELSPNGPARVTVGSSGTTGYVIADCVRTLAVAEKKSPTNVPAKPAVVDGVPFDCPEWAYQWKKSTDFETGGHHRIREIVRPGNYDVPAHGKGRYPGNDINGGVVEKWWVEYGGMLSTIDDAERIRDELFRINLGMWNFAKNHNPNTVARNKNRELVWLNYVPGVRESRRLVGDYMMRQEDYDKQTVHADTVAFTDWGPDVHHPEGFWVHGNDCIHVYQGRRTSIPYRTLYSKNIENLLMAGRCHSATHIALGGTRVMRPMCATGQAAGTAAAIAHQHDTTPRGVYESHVRVLQLTLLKDGCYLLGVKNADPADLALGAAATASSEAAGASAANVNNGWNRVVGESCNAWAPDKGASGPQWVQLQLPKLTEVDTIHVTFENELSPALVQVFEAGQWRTVATIQSNSPARRGVYRFSPLKIEKLRVLFERSSKLNAVCEVRVYREGE